MRTLKVKILGTELEAALLNPNTARNFEIGIGEIAEKARTASTLSVGSDAIEMQCNAVIDFVDAIFGPGSARKVFGDETDLLTCLDAYKDLTSVYEKQVNPMVQAYSDEMLAEINGETKEPDA